MVNFGLDTYGTREIAKDKSKSSRLINNVLSIKIIFALFWYVSLTAVVLIINKPFMVKMVILIIGLNLFVNALSVNWFFFGIEKVTLITSRQIFTNLISLFGIILFVKTKDNIITAACILELASLISTLGILKILNNKFHKVSFILDKIYLKKMIKESFPLLFSTFMIAIYYNLDMVMLGYMKPESDVGIYNAAYRVMLVGVIPFTLILNSFFPQISKIGLKRIPEFKNIFKQYAAVMFPAGIILASIVYFYAGEIIWIVFGNQFTAASAPLRILSLNLLVICVNIFFGNSLIAWGKQKQYSVAIASGAAANIALNILLIPKYSYMGASFATLLSEVAVFMGVFYLFNKYTFKILTV